MNEKLYVITVCDDASDCIPNAEHVERNDELVKKLGKLDEIDDYAAAQMAKADGIKLIDDVADIRKDFYVDTEENRKIIAEYMDKRTAKLLSDIKELKFWSIGGNQYHLDKGCLMTLYNEDENGNETDSVLINLTPKSIFQLIRVLYGFCQDDVKEELKRNVFDCADYENVQKKGDKIQSLENDLFN